MSIVQITTVSSLALIPTPRLTPTRWSSRHQADISDKRPSQPLMLAWPALKRGSDATPSVTLKGPSSRLREQGLSGCDGRPPGRGWLLGGQAPAPSAKRLRGKGKTDTLDAITAARSTVVMELDRLRDRRTGQVQTALKVLTVAREQMNADRLRSINALTALLRTHDLGIDARKAVTNSQIATVAGWRRREEFLGVASARADAVRHAKRIADLDIDLKHNRKQLTGLVGEHGPNLLVMTGVGAVTAAVIMTVWSHPGRIRSEAAFAQIAGTCPIPASSGNNIRHRLNRDHATMTGS